MTYQKVLSGAVVDRDNDMQTVMSLLAEEFAAIRQAHDGPANLVWLGGKLWCVVTSTNASGLEICADEPCSKTRQLKEIADLHSGLLVFRQLEDNQIFIYLIDEIEKIRTHCCHSTQLDWATLDNIKLLSERGAMVNGNLVGFFKLRQLYNFASKSSDQIWD